MVAFVRPQAGGSLADRAVRLAIAGYQVLGLVVFVAGLLLALSWLRQPFPGALLDQARVMTRAAPVGNADSWGLLAQGLKRGDQVRAMGGLPTQSTAALRSALSAFAPGETIEFSIHPTDAPDYALRARLTAFPSPDRTAYLILPTILGLICIVTGTWVFTIRGNQPSGRAFAALCASGGIICNSYFDSLTSHSLTVRSAVDL